jgi:hypothetical protein
MERPDGKTPQEFRGENRGQIAGDAEISEIFTIKKGGNQFSSVSPMK